MVLKQFTKASSGSVPISPANDASSLRDRVIALSQTIVRAKDYAALTKPRVMSLVVFTAVVGLVLAPGQVTPAIGIATIICIAIGAGAAGALNMWYDADIDALMTRTTARPIPSGRVSPKEALGFGLLTSATSVLGLGSATNLEAAGLLAFTIFFYVVVYTAWLKRSTPQSIVIGGAAGAAAPVISWIAATGRLGLEPLLLFLIVFFWTPPHFWALSLNRSSDYRRAGIPVLPVVSGKDETTSQILIYTVLLLPVSVLPWLFGCAGIAYAAVTLASGTAMLLLALRLWRQDVARREAANRLFAFSIFYVVLLFGTLLLERIILT